MRMLNKIKKILMIELGTLIFALSVGMFILPGRILTGGVAGINLYSSFIGEDPDVDQICDHIFHFMELDPDGKHIALGGDLDGCEALPAGFEGVQSYPALAKQLAKRGVDDQLLRKIFWENALGVMETCCM